MLIRSVKPLDSEIKLTWVHWIPRRRKARQRWQSTEKTLRICSSFMTVLTAIKYTNYFLFVETAYIRIDGSRWFCSYFEPSARNNCTKKYSNNLFEISHFSFNIIFRVVYYLHNKLCMEMNSSQSRQAIRQQKDRNLIRETVRIINSWDQCEAHAKQNWQRTKISSDCEWIKNLFLWWCLQSSPCI